mmetsp:Transcript_15572/g.19828  ORF Transcript_15572/g.19828 Transcript_15572/m.19828 type:complete len:280 (-) Transcript_15572:75-914(-)
MKDRRRSVGKGIIHKIAKLNVDESEPKKRSTNRPSVCFLDPACALQKETSPWASDPIYQKPLKGKLTNKIDDDKMELLYHRMRDPVKGLDRKTRTFRFRNHKDCFVASESVDWFISELRLDSREEAVAVGEALTHRGLIAHVLRSEPFQDNSSLHRIIELNDNNLKEQCSEGDLPRLVELMRWALSSRQKYRGRTYENSFSGKECVKFLMQQLGISDRSSAVSMAAILMERCFFYRVDQKDSFSEKAVYKFFQDHRSFVKINSSIKTAAYEKTNLALSS